MGRLLSLIAIDMDFFEWFWALPKDKIDKIIKNGLYFAVYEAYTEGFSYGLKFDKRVATDGLRLTLVEKPTTITT